MVDAIQTVLRDRTGAVSGGPDEWVSKRRIHGVDPGSDDYRQERYYKHHGIHRQGRGLHRDFIVQYRVRLAGGPDRFSLTVFSDVFQEKRKGIVRIRSTDPAIPTWVEARRERTHADIHDRLADCALSE